MSELELMLEMPKHPSFWAFMTIAGGCGIALGYGIYHPMHKGKTSISSVHVVAPVTAESTPPPTTLEPPKAPVVEYPLMTIEDAMKSDADAFAAKVVVTYFYGVKGGYSGMMRDYIPGQERMAIEIVPFYINTKHVEFLDDEAVLPMLFAETVDKSKPLTIHADVVEPKLLQIKSVRGWIGTREYFVDASK